MVGHIKSYAPFICSPLSLEPPCHHPCHSLIGCSISSWCHRTIRLRALNIINIIIAIVKIIILAPRCLARCLAWRCFFSVTNCLLLLSFSSLFSLCLKSYCFRGFNNTIENKLERKVKVKDTKKSTSDQTSPKLGLRWKQNWEHFWARNWEAGSTHNETALFVSSPPVCINTAPEEEWTLRHTSSSLLLLLLYPYVHKVTNMLVKYWFEKFSIMKL